jgi:PAS domain S-box-containing protein
MIAGLQPEVTDQALTKEVEQCAAIRYAALRESGQSGSLGHQRILSHPPVDRPTDCGDAPRTPPPRCHHVVEGFALPGLIATPGTGARTKWDAVGDHRSKDSVRSAERRLRQVLDTAGDAYVAIDDQGTVTEWNRAATTLFGWTRDEALGATLTHLIIPTDLVPQHIAGLERYLLTGEPHILGSPVEVPARRRDGQTFPVEITVWELIDEGRRAFHAFLRDVSDRVRAAEELRQSNEDLQAFAAMAAHDLRSPLAMAGAYATLLSDQLAAGTFDPGQAPGLLQRIRTATDRGLALVEQLLRYSAIGQSSLQVETIDLAELVASVVEDQAAGTDRAAAFEVDDLPEVSGSRPLLRQLLGNLIGNALKYVPQDRDVHVRIDALVEDPDWVSIRVSDNGDPIDAADAERLFGIFERGHDHRIAGSGVGLAICQRVAEAHGGHIGIDPGYDQGNRFCVVLPSQPTTP